MYVVCIYVAVKFGIRTRTSSKGRYLQKLFPKIDLLTLTLSLETILKIPTFAGCSSANSVKFNMWENVVLWKGQLNIGIQSVFIKLIFAGPLSCRGDHDSCGCNA